MAPPHTRGSTLCRRDVPGAHRGSPAHAGIDPRGIPPRIDRGRLPRTRGDRPAAWPDALEVAQAPPHTRGSTRRQRLTELATRGSPAHAGIDPQNRPDRRYTHRLPRTRGDRPCTGLPTAGVTGAPPHTRGSTRRSTWSPATSTGSPAHAGIDLPRSISGVSTIRLPRTRGDRPWVWMPFSRAMAAPPHTRGSTRPPHSLCLASFGSPAHAGIDLHQESIQDEGGWLPRTRGDRPSRYSRMASRAAAPPHTRGSTPGFGRGRGVVRGSPAHAGIDPRSAARHTDHEGLPRTRGDRPQQHCGAQSPTWAPPHTRGSTARRGLGSRGCSGSPAHAGIDLPTSGR